VLVQRCRVHPRDAGRRLNPVRESGPVVDTALGDGALALPADALAHRRQTHALDHRRAAD